MASKESVAEVAVEGGGITERVEEIRVVRNVAG